MTAVAMTDLTIRRPDGPGVLWTHAEVEAAARGRGVDPDLARQLALLRISFGQPIELVRLQGYVVEVRTPDPAFAFLLARKAFEAGWSIGVGDELLRLDRHVTTRRELYWIP